MARPQRHDRTDKLTEAHHRLATAVAELVSGDDWQRFLALASTLHGYSARNVLLIHSQVPWATKLAGYRKWQELGRQVRAGAKGIAILAPCRYRSAAADDRDDPADPRPRVVVRGFRVVYLFDISATDGPPIVDITTPELLHGHAPEGLWDGLAAQITAKGYTLERGDCGGANGRTHFDTKVVRVRDDVDDAQMAKSECHELAHLLLHDGSEYAAGCRGRAEVEAESVAHLVCVAAGLRTDIYSYPYLAGWSGGDPDVVLATAERVVECARRILDGLGLGAGAAPAPELVDAREPST